MDILALVVLLAIVSIILRWHAFNTGMILRNRHIIPFFPNPIVIQGIIKICDRR